MSQEQQGAQEERPLPAFRADLEVYRGPDDPDGGPTYNIYDPVRAQYYKVTWAEATVLRVYQPGMTLTQLVEAVNLKSTLRVDAEEIEGFIKDAATKGLLVVPRSSDALADEVEARKENWLWWMLKHYLYIRIPLMNPNKFLQASLPYVQWLVSPIMVMLYIFLSFLGLFFLAGRVDEYIYTFPYFFNLDGLVLYALAILGVKVIHEFAHAYTAARYGVIVPSMGIALIVMWPVMYTDVTDSWKLMKRSQRFMIAFAGVTAELVIAGLSILGWVMTADGPMHSMFFVLSSVTLISTLLINLNPAMRFDGYYLLSDLWGVDNLQSRAFAVARWKLRKWFLGLDMPSPEDPVYERYYLGMVVYSIFTWIYRLFLYAAIAALVYYKFTKSLGIILFIAEILFFIVSPLWGEFKRLRMLRPLLSFNPRSIGTTALVCFVTLWCVVPWPHVEYFSAITAPKENQIFYANNEGVISKLLIDRGQKVEKGMPLIELSSVELNAEMADQYYALKIIQAEIDTYSQDDENQSLIPEKQAELATARAQIRGLMERQNKNLITAQVSGVVYDLDDYLGEGQTVAKDQVLGRLADIAQANVVFYVPEKFIGDIIEGEEISFRLANTFDWYDGIIQTVSPVRATELTHPQLASLYGGDLAVTEQQQGELQMVDSYYQVRVDLMDPEAMPRFGQTGDVAMRMGWRSKIWHWTQSLLSLFWRESAF